MEAVSSLPRSWWWGFALYGVISLIHIAALAIEAPIAGPTKLLLMPALILATMWAGRGSGWGTSYSLLIVALAFSYLGDGAGAFFPFAPELPMMLLCFGLAHLCYIWLFWRRLAVRRLPALVRGLRRLVARSAARPVAEPGRAADSCRALRPRPRRHRGRGIPLPSPDRLGRRVLPRLRHRPRLPPLRAGCDARLDQPARDDHVLPRSGPHRGRRRRLDPRRRRARIAERGRARMTVPAPPPGAEPQRPKPRTRRPDLGPRRRVAVGGARLQDPLGRDDGLPCRSRPGQRRPCEGGSARPARRRTAGAHRGLRPDPRGEAAHLQARRRGDGR